MAVEKRELPFENKLIQYLTSIGGSKQWRYVPEIKTTEQLWHNFKQILEVNNQDQLQQKQLSSTEFNQVKQVITNLATPYQAGQFLYGMNGKSQVEVDLDDGRHVYLTVFDQDNIGAGNTVYQVVNQIERPAVVAGFPNCRFDTTLLINGLPIIQIEEKADGHDAKEALNQMHKYIVQQQYSGIFATLQILVAILPHDIRYMANTTAELFNLDFAFHWQREKDNLPVFDWHEFCDQMLSIPMAHMMATNFMILDGTKNRQMLKVMRSYQVYATRKVLNKIRQHTFGIDSQELGYIWHTTGSGKTISSFKTAWLASRLPNVDKVVFLVDRVALTNQTFSEYQAYDPDSDDNNQNGVVTDTANKARLWQQLKTKSTGIIVTSTQKMDGLARQGRKLDRRIVFVVDEAHRSTAGEMLQRIKKAFPNSAWVGYTGTPRFDEKQGLTTQQIFGDLLHSYTIKAAIADKNVLGFKVDFETTLASKTLKETYLPEYFKQLHPQWTNEQIQVRIEHLNPDDMDDMIEPSVYDFNEDHIRLVVKDVLAKWISRSNNYQFNALFTTHVGGGKASTPMAIKYYDEFCRQNRKLKRPLKIAVTFSQATNNGDQQLTNNLGLHRAIQDYNQQFGTNFDDTQVKEYTADVVARLNKTIDDGNYLDLVIVVDQLLTGFDAPQLNTLYVDRLLQGANLIQAYSRTNRIFDLQSKPFGHIVNYRWPQHSEQLMKKALAIYANPDSADVQQELKGLESTGVLAKTYKELKGELKQKVTEISDLTTDFQAIPPSEHQQEQLYQDLQKYNHLMAQLKQDDHYDVKHPEKLLQTVGLTSDQEVLLTTTFANQLRRQVAERHHIELKDLTLKMEHVKDIQVDYDYLNELLAQLANQVHENETAAAEKTQKAITSIAEQITDDSYRTTVRNFSQALLDNQVEIPDYPVKGKDINELITNHQQNELRSRILAFKRQWGLIDIPDTQKVNQLIEQHSAGVDDLNQTGELNDIIREGQELYVTDAEDLKIKQLPKLKYRTHLRRAFKELADHLKE